MSKKSNKSNKSDDKSDNECKSKFDFKPMLATNIDDLYNNTSKKIPNVDGWIVTEKLDGIRGIYKDGCFYTRTGKSIMIPEEFYDDMLDVSELKGHILDGELWISRKNFDKLAGLMNRDYKSMDDIKNVKFMIFDIPTLKKVYIDRVLYLQKVIKDKKHFKLLETSVINNIDDLPKLLEDIELIGGEGLILRNPSSKYEEGKRSKQMLKVKSFITDEGKYVGFKYGQKNGKYKDKVGSYTLEWKNPNNDVVRFDVGTGFTDESRELTKLPNFGTKITFKYIELTKNGVPRHPVFIAIRDYE